MTEARRIFWRRLSGLISGAEVYGGDMETYEHEDDEQEEFSKARYHRKLGGPRGKGYCADSGWDCTMVVSYYKWVLTALKGNLYTATLTLL